MDILIRHKVLVDLNDKNYIDLKFLNNITLYTYKMHAYFVTLYYLI